MRLIKVVEEDSTVCERSIYEHPEYLGRLSERIESVAKRVEEMEERLKWYKGAKEKTKEKNESLLPKYPLKEEKKEIIKIETVLPLELWEKRLTGYGAEEKERRIIMPIAEVGRDVFAFSEVLQHQKIKSKVKSSISLQNIISTTLKSQSLTATASVTTIISLFALYYGFLRGYWALVGIGIMSLVVVFIDLWKVSLRESGKHERSAIKAY